MRLNILVALLIGAVLVVVHAVVRKIDDLFLDEEAYGLMMGLLGFKNMNSHVLGRT